MLTLRPDAIYGWEATVTDSKASESISPPPAAWGALAVIASLGGFIGVLLDVIQKRELNAASALSEIIGAHIDLPLPPIIYVLVLIVIGAVVDFHDHLDWYVKALRENSLG